jgi:hypothetical protein
MSNKEKPNSNNNKTTDEKNNQKDSLSLQSLNLLISSKDSKLKFEEEKNLKLTNLLNDKDKEINGLRNKLQEVFVLQKHLDSLEVFITTQQEESEQLNNLVSTTLIKFEEDYSLVKKTFDLEISQLKGTLDMMSKRIEHTQLVEQKLLQQEKIVEDTKKQFELFSEKLLDEARKQKLDYALEIEDMKNFLNEKIEKSKRNFVKTSLSHLDIAGKISMIQNHKLITEVDYKSSYINFMQVKLNELTRRVAELNDEIEIHKNLERKLLKQNQTITKEAELLRSSFNNILTEISNKNFSNQEKENSSNIRQSIISELKNDLSKKDKNSNGIVVKRDSSKAENISKVKFNINSSSSISNKLDYMKPSDLSNNSKELVLPNINNVINVNKSSNLNNLNNLNQSLISNSKTSSKQASSINVLSSSSIKNRKEEAMINNSRRRQLKKKQTKNSDHKLSFMYKINVSNNIEFDRKSIKPNKSNIEEDLNEVYNEDYEAVSLNENKHMNKKSNLNENFSEKILVENQNEFTNFDNEGYGENVYNTIGVYEKLQKEKQSYNKILDKIGKSSKEVYLMTSN